MRNFAISRRHTLACRLAGVLAVAACSSSPSPGSSADAGASVDASATDGSGATPACVVGAPTDAQTVATTQGLIRGNRSDSGLSFLGVPFAAPPVGDLRFEPPEPHACWADVRDATAFGPECAQADLITGDVTGSEDCLTLNVWTPSLANAPTAKRPVLFFIYGGGEAFGATDQVVLDENLYDATEFAQSQDAVVVTFNYRLGALGFLAHPALTAQSAHQSSGNYGLEDGIAALQWVQANIAQFGGDPTHAMIFGESAGAYNTCALLSSPLAHGLFSSALMESGICEQPTLADRYQEGSAFASAVHCEGVVDEVACLQSASLADIIAASGSLLSMAPGTGTVDPKSISELRFGPTVDGYVLPVSPIAALRAGTYNQVPLVIGTNHDEFGLFSLLPGEIPTTCGDYQSRLTANFGSLAAQIAALYPCDDSNPLAGHDAFVKVYTDLWFTCSSRRASIAAATSQSAPVYRYLFSHTYDYGAFLPLGAFHASELPFVFQTFGALGYIQTPDETDLSNRMQTRWAAFARTGNPNTATSGLAWPQFDPTLDNALTLDNSDGVENGFEKTQCALWDAIQQ